ncbi:DUF1609 domain-containing protein [Encephalitozoon cuniculi]|nr:DUF1609 domain-containing protein [Encephalitozoon cuniculi]
MRVWLVCMVGLLGGLHGSDVEESEDMKKVRKVLEKAFSRKLYDSEVERIRTFEKELYLDTRVMIPFIFHGDRVVALPTTRYQDVDKSEKKYVEGVVMQLRWLVWRLMAWVYVPGGSSWIESLINEVFEATVSRDPDPVSLYKGARRRSGIRLMDLVMKVFKQNVSMVSEFGQRLARSAEDRMQGIPGSLSPEERKKEEEMLWKIKEHGERLCTKERQEEMVRAQEIICDVCAYVWEKDEDRMSFIMEVYSRHLCLKIVMPYTDIEVPLISYIDHHKLVSTDEKYKSVDIMAEVFKQAFIEHKGIDDESINNAVREVRERKRLEEMREMEERKRREEERAKNEEELLRMVEREKREESKGRGKKKGGKRGAGEAKEESKEEDRKEEEGVEAEEEESAEVPLVETAVGGARRKKSLKGKRKGDGHHYKIHSRVLRWKRSAEKIKRELDEGYEKKWRGKSVEEIKEQKKVHDIVEVLELLKSKECDRFFFRTGKYMKGGSERWKMVANGILEEGGEKKVGKVEVGLFKGERGESVVYHLMFRPTETERAGMVGGSSFGKGDDVDEIKKEESSDMSGFRYPSGVRCEMTSNGNEFRIEYRNPKNTSEVLRTLTILRIPEI